MPPRGESPGGAATLSSIRTSLALDPEPGSEDARTSPAMSPDDIEVPLSDGVNGGENGAAPAPTASGSVVSGGMAARASAAWGSSGSGFIFGADAGAGAGVGAGSIFDPASTSGSTGPKILTIPGARSAASSAACASRKESISAVASIACELPDEPWPTRTAVSPLDDPERSGTPAW